MQNVIWFKPCLKYNFTAPLLNGQYIEVVCPLDYPASYSSPFGKAVSKRAAEGGRWLTWVVAVEDLSAVETRLGRPAVDGHRTKPDGTDLSWKQIGVIGTLEDRQMPFFAEWIKNHHPSTDGKAVAKITKIEIDGDESAISDRLGSEVKLAIGSGIEIEWFSADANDGDTGIVAVHLDLHGNVVRVEQRFNLTIKLSCGYVERTKSD